MKFNRILILFLVLVVLTGCSKLGIGVAEEHRHTWVAATCTSPAVCSTCGEQLGEALGHDWLEATCTEPRRCSRCGIIDGYALGHAELVGDICTRCKQSVSLSEIAEVNPQVASNFEKTSDSVDSTDIEKQGIIAESTKEVTKVPTVVASPYEFTFDENCPTLEDTDAFTVVGSYFCKKPNSVWNYAYLIYVVQANQTISSDVKLTISAPSGDILDTSNDTINLTQGELNCFSFYIEDVNSINKKNSYKFNVDSHENWLGSATSSAEVIKYNKKDDNVFVTVRQTCDSLASFAKLKVLYFDKKGKLINIENDGYYSVLAKGLKKYGDEDVIQFSYYNDSFKDIVFFYEHS